MSDLISRKVLLNKLETWLCDICEMPKRGGPCGGCIVEAISETIKHFPAVDAEPVRHGRWILEAHDERVNCRWNVTARCSECSDEENEIWAGFFPGVPDCIAKDVALQDARQVKLSNYCPNCGAKMDAEDAQHGP